MHSEESTRPPTVAEMAEIGLGLFDHLGWSHQKIRKHFLDITVPEADAAYEQNQIAVFGYVATPPAAVKAEIARMLDVRERVAA